MRCSSNHEKEKDYIARDEDEQRARYISEVDIDNNHEYLAPSDSQAMSQLVTQEVSS